MNNSKPLESNTPHEEDSVPEAFIMGKTRPLVDMDKITSLSRRRGFVYPSSEIYGGMANTWDYGPLGVELKNNFKKLWWQHFVQERIDIIGLSSAIIMNPKVWEASGHIESFSDILVDCLKCKMRFRADHLIEKEKGIDVEGQPEEEVNRIFKEERITCPNCGADKWTKTRSFNLLFKTYVGATEDAASTAYLRGEAAQGMFVNFKNILESTRKKLPLGIAQIGKAFRNEITPGNYIFRTREFELAEFEYFIKPDNWEKVFDYWLEEMLKFGELLGIKKEKIHLHEIPPEKRAHYSKRTVDLEFRFPFGMKELWGIAYRTDYDLKQHQKYSGEDMSYTDPLSGEKFIPHVIEPTFGVERSLLAILVNAYDEDEAPDEQGKMQKRVVLRLPKYLAPYQVAILPLSKHSNLSPKAKAIFDMLKDKFTCEYDETQSIGKRYRRQDEIGTPYCVTVDFETLKDEAVTIRDRDTMKQKRIKINRLKAALRKGLE